MKFIIQVLLRINVFALTSQVSPRCVCTCVEGIEVVVPHWPVSVVEFVDVDCGSPAPQCGMELTHELFDSSWRAVCAWISHV